MWLPHEGGGFALVSGVRAIESLIVAAHLRVAQYFFVLRKMDRSCSLI
jgi:hypothetical protein